MQKKITADKIFTGTGWLQQKAITCEEGTIKNITPLSAADQNVTVYNNAFIAPAFIDVQLYGAFKKLLSVYPQVQTLQLMYDYCVQGGATLFLPTVATNSMEVLKSCIDAVKQYWQQGGKGVYGLHLEGPWINKDKRGAHIEAFVTKPTIAAVKTLLDYGHGVIKMITLAPEICEPDVVQFIQSSGIVVSAGHSNATYNQAMEAFNNGITTATHLYNAMSGLQHREPGMVGALFQHPTARCSVIPDGHHVAYAAIAIAKKIMGHRLFAITDAVTQTSEGPYQHYLHEDRYLCGNTLSGSALTTHKAFYNLVKSVGIDVAEALRMCSLYPAQVLQQENKHGQIAPGYAAQFVVLSNDLALVDVIT